MNVSHETEKDFSKKLIVFVFHMKQSGCKGKGEKVFHVKHMLKCLWGRLALKVSIFCCCKNVSCETLLVFKIFILVSCETFCINKKL